MFTHMETAVRDVMRILNQPGVHEALKDFSPEAYKEMLLPWLNRAAKQIVETPPEGEVGRTVARVARALRRRSGMAFMFMNVANALQQIAGLSWEDARRILISKGIDGLLSVIRIVLLLSVVGAAAKFVSSQA
jgi:hypothetical protein